MREREKREGGMGGERGGRKTSAIEARQSNEHIDLIRLIVLQLISAPAPVTKMKG